MTSAAASLVDTVGCSDREVSTIDRGTRGAVDAAFVVIIIGRAAGDECHDCDGAYRGRQQCTSPFVRMPRGAWNCVSCVFMSPYSNQTRRWLQDFVKIVVHLPYLYPQMMRSP